MVKGITANVIANNARRQRRHVPAQPRRPADDAADLRLGFGQPRFSRESIAEFQIVTNLFDITQGRSAGMQVQAMSRSGTNKMQGSVYGFFRDDALNAPDAVTRTVLPYQNQQIGGSLGGPIVRDKAHFFASYKSTSGSRAPTFPHRRRCRGRASRPRTATRRRACSRASISSFRPRTVSPCAARAGTGRTRSSSSPAGTRRTRRRRPSRRPTSSAPGRASSGAGSYCEKSTSHRRLPRGARAGHVGAARGEAGRVAVYGGDQGGMKYSPLTQITNENVARLEIAWEWKTGEQPLPQFRTTPGAFQNTPLMIDNVLYLSTPYNRVVALDAETGRSCGPTIRRPTRKGRSQRAGLRPPRRRRVARRRASCASSSTAATA